jgi:hypothetical protein
MFLDHVYGDVSMVIKKVLGLPVNHPSDTINPIMKFCLVLEMINDLPGIVNFHTQPLVFVKSDASSLEDLRAFRRTRVDRSVKGIGSPSRHDAVGK